jgi:hypothetical protein
MQPAGRSLDSNVITLRKGTYLRMHFLKHVINKSRICPCILQRTTLIILFAIFEITVLIVRTVCGYCVLFLSLLEFLCLA